MSTELDKQLADLIERSHQTDRRIEQVRVDKLRQLISDVNDAALYDRSQLEERIDALEQRIEAVEWLTDIVKTHSKLFDAILRRLNHKSLNIAGESIKIDGELIENGGGE